MEGTHGLGGHQQPGLRPVAFPGAFYAAQKEASLEAELETPDPTEWRFGPQTLKALRPLETVAKLDLRPERRGEQLPCALEPTALEPGAPNAGGRTCMRCWLSVAPLYCGSCSKFFCGPCAAKAHSSADTKSHRVGTAARGHEVSLLQLPQGLAARVEGDSFALELAPAARRSIQCPRHTDAPAQFACLDCSFAVFCAHCAEQGLHAEHKVVNVRAAVQAARQQMADQYSQLKQQAQSLHAVIASLKGLQKRAAKLHSVTAAQIKEAFESVVLALEERDEAANREAELVKNLSGQRLKAVDADCRVLLRYLQVKKQQLDQLKALASRSSVLALNAFVDIAPTIEALEERTDCLQDMRERLQVPYWQLRVLEIDGLLSDRQEALQDLSSRVSSYCESASAAVNSFLTLKLPLDAPPVEHRETERLEASVEARRLHPVVYPKGLDPYSQRFLRQPPDMYQAFVRKDQLHPQWEVRVVSLRGPYLCVHVSEDDPSSSVESAWVLGKNTFARTFADPGVTALATLAKADYLHGIEVVAIDLKARELQAFLLLAADGQRLATEWAEAIDMQCLEDAAETEPEAPAHDPTIALEALHLEAAGTPFPVPHRRKAAMLLADLQGESSGDRASSVSSQELGQRETEGSLSSDSEESPGEETQARAEAPPVTDSELAAVEALQRVAAPMRPTVRRQETKHWETDARPGTLYRRRQKRAQEAERGSPPSAALKTVVDDSSSSSSGDGGRQSLETETDSPEGAGKAKGGGSPGPEEKKIGERTAAGVASSWRPEKVAAGAHVNELVQQIEAKVALVSPRGAKHADARRHGSSATTSPQVETLDYAHVEERQEPRGAVGSPEHGSSSSSKQQTPHHAFKEDPYHAESPPVTPQREQADRRTSALTTPAADPAAAPAADAAAAPAADSQPRSLVMERQVHAAAPSREHPRPLRAANALEELPAHAASPPLRSRFSYTAGLETPSQRRRQRDTAAGGDRPPCGDFLKVKMPPKKAIPTFDFSGNDAGPSRRKHSPPPQAAAAAAEEPKALGTTKIRGRTPTKGGPGVLPAAAAAAVAPRATTPQGPRRLFSTPTLPSPVKAARLVPLERQAETSNEAAMVQRVLRQIGSLKISSSGAASQLARSSSSMPGSAGGDSE